MKIYNSLTRKPEDFFKDNDEAVGMYTCGPTVYSYVTIGNWRTYTLADLLVRVLRINGYEVEYVMNITDVGHLTGDNLGDADRGDDRLEKAARKENKTAWEIADFYTNDFLWGYKQLNLVEPKVFCKATDHIDEQIGLVKKLGANHLTYKISDGVYFDVQAYEKLGYKYGELSTLDQIAEGARVEVNTEKRDGRDFALWKFSKPEEKRQMEWDSPWGRGFPGWHIECSAMSMAYLGEQFDVHVGGEDLRSTHHPNEIAQSEGATGKQPFVRYWLHGAFLLVDGGRMGKSLGNAFTLTDVLAKGFAALDLRYFYLTGHYRKQLNFTWEGLEAASKTLARLRERVANLNHDGELDMNEYHKWHEKFISTVSNDLNMPEALAVVWDLLKSEVGDNLKYELLVKNWDLVLGLNLGKKETMEISEEAKKLIAVRDEARKNKDWGKSDELRGKLQEMGYEVEDTAEGTRMK